jgi:hypothetical protein
VPPKENYNYVEAKDLAETHHPLGICALLIKEVEAILIIRLNVFRQCHGMPGKNMNCMS